MRQGPLPAGRPQIGRPAGSGLKRSTLQPDRHRQCDFSAAQPPKTGKPQNNQQPSRCFIAAEICWLKEREFEAINHSTKMVTNFRKPSN